VGSIVDTLRIRTLRKLVEASRNRCDALVARFETATTVKKKSKIALKYDKVLKRTHALQFQLEKQERKSKNGGVGEQGTRSRVRG
jgi:hypothetical protein